MFVFDLDVIITFTGHSNRIFQSTIFTCVNISSLNKFRFFKLFCQKADAQLLAASTAFTLISNVSMVSRMNGICAIMDMFWFAFAAKKKRENYIAHVARPAAQQIFTFQWQQIRCRNDAMLLKRLRYSKILSELLRSPFWINGIPWCRNILM